MLLQFSCNYSSCLPVFWGPHFCLQPAPPATHSGAGLLPITGSRLHTATPHHGFLLLGAVLLLQYYLQLLAASICASCALLQHKAGRTTTCRPAPCDPSLPATLDHHARASPCLLTHPDAFSSSAPVVHPVTLHLRLFLNVQSTRSIMLTDVFTTHPAMTQDGGGRTLL